MKRILSLLLTFTCLTASADLYKTVSPNGEIELCVNNSSELTYSIVYKGDTVVGTSHMGFEFANESPMNGNFKVVSYSNDAGIEQWAPVVRNKHSEIAVHYNSLKINLQEKAGGTRSVLLLKLLMS